MWKGDREKQSWVFSTGIENKLEHMGYDSNVNFMVFERLVPILWHCHWWLRNLYGLGTQMEDMDH